LTPLGHSPDADLIAEIRGRLFRVQVKTSTFAPSWTGVTKLFDPSRFDLLFALVGDGRRWFDAV
jgi:hypothetical protein